MKKLYRNIPDLPKWLLVTFGIAFIIRIPSFFEPFYYGDELIYLTLGNAIRHGLVLYKDIHDNKTPLIYFLAAIAGNIFWFRVILCAWSIATIFLFWKLVELLFPKRINTQRMATLVFAVLTTLPILEGQIANAELFMIGFIIAAFIFILKGRDSLKNFFFAGVCISVATLFKVPALFDAGAIVFFVFLVSKSSIKNIKRDFLRIFILGVGIAIPLLGTLLWYGTRGALSDYINAAFLQNLGYVASQRTGSVINSAPFLVKNGPILIRATIVALGFGILLFLRKKLSLPFLIAAAWLLTSLFAATLSERPYPHYLIQVVPSFSILFGILLSLEEKEQSLVVIPLFLAFLAPTYYNFWYYPSAPYFARFSLLLKGQNQGYFSQFGDNVLANYAISKEIVATTKDTDPVFVWGDSPPIYALTRRLPPIKYVANYHIGDYSSVPEIVGLLTQKRPQLIVIMPNEETPRELYELLKLHYLKLETVQKAEFWYNMHS